MQALNIFEAIKDTLSIACCYECIGMVYSWQKNYNQALENYFSALEIFKSIGASPFVSGCYDNIGLLYTDQGHYDEALKSLMMALEIWQKLQNKDGMAYSFVSIGNVYSAQENYSAALEYYFKALKTGDSSDHYLTTVAVVNLGLTYTKMNQAREGKVWLQKGLNLGKLCGTKDFIMEAYRGLSSADSILGNYRQALEYYKQYALYKDSLFNEDNTRKLTQFSMQYEFDKKQLADSLKNQQARKTAAEELKKQEFFTGAGLSLALVFLGFIGFTVRNNRKLSAEKRKSESLLHNILPEEISAELKERGATTAHEHEHVTILFTDFVNFTLAGERMTSQELVEELHHCFKAFDEIMENYGIEKIKTIGDAYLAVCGLPQPDVRHAEKVVSAAIEIRSFMYLRKQKLGDRTFEVRIGIHSGSVVAGIVGIKKFVYDIWGDTVNTAARMEQKSEAGKINISKATHDLVKDRFECTFRGEIAAKNKGMLKMYFVHNLKTDSQYAISGSEKLHS